MSFIRRLTRWWGGPEDERARQRALEDESRTGGDERFDHEDFEATKDDVHIREVLPSLDDPSTHP
jgi:hypothetical protein